MSFEKIVIHQRNIKARLNSFKIDSDISEKEKKDVVEFLRLCELGKINKGKKLSESRQLKYLDILRIPFTYFKKDTATLTLSEVERFDTDLSKDKIRNRQTGNPLSQNTKVDIRKLFKIYLRWKLEKNPLKFKELTEWWDTTYKTKTPDYLTEQEIIKLYEHCKNPAERFLIAVLFDSGARIQEFLNLRFRDITEPTKEFPYYVFDFKDEYAKQDKNGKGRGRKIGLFWARSEKAIRDYINSLEDTKKDTPVFSSEKEGVLYDNIRAFLNRIGNKVLTRTIHPHLFRHSSATYYANKINRQELCIRYGWAFSSKMPDTYIARAGVDQKQIMESFKAKGMDTYKLENEQLKEQITNLQLQNMETQKKIDTLFETLNDSLMLNAVHNAEIIHNPDKKIPAEYKEELKKYNKKFEKYFEKKLNKKKK